MTTNDDRVVRIQTWPLDAAQPCRYCLAPAWSTDRVGPLHKCCQYWADQIKLGKPCPACVASRVAARARRLR
jgi:hypothetical protein